MFPTKEERKVLQDLHDRFQEQEPKYYVEYQAIPEGYFAMIKTPKGSVIHSINVREFEEDHQIRLNNYIQKLSIDVSLFREAV